MQLEIPRHERVRFRRDEICDLSALPSAAGQALPRSPRPRASRRRLPPRATRIALRTVAVLLCLFAAILGVLYAIGASGVGTERLRLEAEAALRRIAGPELAASIGPAHVSLGGTQLLALKVSDLRISNRGVAQVEAGSLRFGIQLVPLLGGDFRLGSARIADARISLAGLPLQGSGDWTQRIRNEDGLLDPDLAGTALFEALRQALDMLERGGTSRIELERTELVLSETGRVRSLLVSEASLEETGSGILSLAAVGTLDGRAVSLKGVAEREPASRRIASLRLEATVAPAEALVLDASGLLSRDGSKSRLGAAEISITGAENDGDGPSRLAVAARLDDSVIDLGKRGVVLGDADVSATLLTGANKIEIDRMVLATGRSRFEMTGAVGPQPREMQTPGEPAYRYEFVTDKAVLAPVDSPEEPIELSARMAGRFDERSRVLTADELAIRTIEGELRGSAAARFEPRKTPGISLTLSASEMPVAHIKQFWPWLAAGKARRWALENVFGGRMISSEVSYSVAPGRIGDGVPLKRDEIFGRFVLADSRFDTTGSLPPIRDAAGVIEFRGNDVDITLSTGNAFLPGGRKVGVSNGVLTFRDANVEPVVGNLDLDIEGEAAAVAELASLDPINAMERLKLAPADFSGHARGHIKTEVPTRKDAELAALKWQVKLDVSDFSLAQPLEGQKLAGADGTITVDPRRAVLELDGTLNDVPAELRIVEPLREGADERVRDIVLTLNDKHRSRLAPGLDGLVAGTLILKIDASARSGIHTVTADLAKAKLSLPWVGWSKGAGVPANVSFDLARQGDASRLSDFELKGESFAIAGTVELADGALASAKFDTVRLNRGDAARVDVSRQGKGYAVTVRASAIDARSVIKLVLGSTGGNAGSAGGAEKTTVSVKASVDRLAGFHGEALSNVELAYRDGQGRDAAYSLSGVTGGGGAVTISSTSEQGRSLMRVQSADAGSLVRFLDIYERMQGGEVDLTLREGKDGAMRGELNATNFRIVDEQRLGSLVSSKPAGSQRSLSQAVNRDIDTARAEFSRAYAAVEKGDGYLKVADGVLRGPVIGATFQGTLYDRQGNIDMTGTFMPAYGINRLFGELPIIGALLGNGRDRGLIGVTFKLEGKASKPQLQINPLSVIAPGVFRQIFEFR